MKDESFWVDRCRKPPDLQRWLRAIGHSFPDIWGEEEFFLISFTTSFSRPLGPVLPARVPIPHVEVRGASGKIPMRAVTGIVHELLEVVGAMFYDTIRHLEVTTVTFSVPKPTMHAVVFGREFLKEQLRSVRCLTGRSGERMIVTPRLMALATMGECDWTTKDPED